MKRKNATQPVEYVHSDWLQLVVELGLVGFALLVFPPLFLLVSSRGREFDKLTRCLLWGCALFGVLILWEFSLAYPANAFLLAVMSAMACQRVAALKLRREPKS